MACTSARTSRPPRSSRARSTCEVIASGGVGSLDDLARLRDAGIAAVVVGRALYDRRFTVDEAARVAHGAT